MQESPEDVAHLEQEIARLLITVDKGPGFRSLGHYQPTFKMTVTKP